jgi:hypothetical protein
MASSFSANQYNNAFVPKKIQNWEVPKEHREDPRKPKGTSKIIADDNGYLLPEYKRSDTATWSNFVGTWDMPKKLPGTKIDIRTARDPIAYEKLQRDFKEAREVLSGRRKAQSNTDTMVPVPTTLPAGDEPQARPQSRPQSRPESRPQSNRDCRATPQRQSPLCANGGNETDRTFNGEDLAGNGDTDYCCVAAL